LQTTGNELLRYAAEKEFSGAVYVHSIDLMRKKNYHEALKFVERGLKLFEEGSILYDKLLRRKERLEKKLNHLTL